jgi:hypothetical protein
MTDDAPHYVHEPVYSVNSDVIGLVPAVSVGHNMLALAGALSRDYAATTVQMQLNYMIAMVSATQQVTGSRGASDAPAVTAALDLVKQVVATAQAN